MTVSLDLGARCAMAASMGLSAAWVVLVFGVRSAVGQQLAVETVFGEGIVSDVERYQKYT